MGKVIQVHIQIQLIFRREKIKKKKNKKIKVVVDH